MSKKNLNTHMHIHTHIKELLALNTLHVPVFLHTRTQQFRVAPDEKYSSCMCTFANEIKTIYLFEYEQMQVNIVYLKAHQTYIDVHLSHFISTPVFVALQPIKFKLVAQLQSLA